MSIQSPVRQASSPGHQVRVTNFVSFGPLVLDQVQFSNGTSQSDVPGGTGLYATLGARLAVPSSSSTTVGSIVVAGNDFPAAILNQIQGWGINLIVHREPNKPSTRGRLVYHDDAFGEKTFTFMTEPLFPRPSFLLNSSLLRSTAFHFLDTPQSLRGVIQELSSMRLSAGIQEIPKIVWEPKPSACQFNQLSSHLQACQLVDVFSPNHLELTSLVEGTDGSLFQRQTIERCVKRVLNSGVGRGRAGYVVVRCGEHGSYIRSANSSGRWFPPYHTDPHYVVDATGAGNAFLGGFTMGMQIPRGDIIDAVIHGTVAASLVIEQFGLPTRSVVNNAERWNGVDVLGRLQEYRARLSQGN